MLYRQEKWGDICSQDKRVCLSDRDLVYLLDTRREQRSTRNWRRLFPSVLSTCAESGFLKEHQNWSLTLVEQLAVAMERSFLRKTSTFSDLNIPKIPAGPATGGEGVSENLHNRRGKEDPNSRLYLSAIEVSPSLTIEYGAFTDKRHLDGSDPGKV
ncbi:uncharacterized protein LOC101859839 [Aplysia californica]|uniref:Uncharacterized protein LOC101859839 n=1 Tax=Aplysia californica TaxID=6500 RepID=A0ABM1W4C1_APLCA|nr:uncharacterized protein LOC101859839 [Aplysia californica]